MDPGMPYGFRYAIWIPGMPYGSRYAIWNYQCIQALPFTTTCLIRPDALPGVNHMRGMQYQIVTKFYILDGTKLIQLYNLCAEFLHKTPKLFHSLNRPLVASYDIHG